MKRPVLYWISLFILGEFVSMRLPVITLGGCVIGVLLVILCTPFLFYRSKKDKHLSRIWNSGMIAFLLGVACVMYLSGKVQILQSTYEKEIAFYGKVISGEVKNTNYYYTLHLKQLTIGEQSYLMNQNIRLAAKQDMDLYPGDVIWGTGTGKAYRRASNPGGYDEQSYQYSNGNYLDLESVRIIKKKCFPFGLRYLLFQLRSKLTDIYQNILPEKEASLAAAMVLGDKQNLDTDIKQMYQKNGIAHLLAISGLHIAMIGGTLYRLLRKWIGGYVIPVGTGIVFVLFYGMLTGLAGATCRAAVMLSLSFVADLTGRKYDLISSLFIALFLMLAKNPYQMTQTGFLLSFGAILGIAVIYPIWNLWIENLPKWTDALFVSISVQLILIPVMLYYFYEIPVYGVFLNVLVIPMMGVLLACLILAGLVGLFNLSVASCIVIPVRIIFKLYEILCGLWERIPGNIFCMGRPDKGWMIGYYGILILLLLYTYFGKRKWRVFIRYCCFLLLFFCYPVVERQDLFICMFDVGQGDGIYIRTPEQDNILVDGGSSSQKNIGTYILKNGLKYYGCNHLDYVIVTHSDSDHYSGISELLENAVLPIDNLILPDIQNPDAAYLQLEKLAEKRGCRVYHMKEEDQLVFGKVRMECFNPQNISYEDKNTGSLVFWLNFKEFDMLLTGDMDSSVEKRLENRLSESAKKGLDVLKVAHHGSDTASSKDFLEKLQPAFACISVGSQNRYGHPHAQTIENLEAVHTGIFRTDRQGAICIHTDGATMDICGYLDEKS